MSWIATDATLTRETYEYPRMEIGFEWVPDGEQKAVINRERIAGIALPLIELEGEETE